MKHTPANTINGIPLIECGGILAIGDPHLSFVKPGRRADAGSWRDTSLDKLGQALRLAERHNWLPVILGDLFDETAEADGMRRGNKLDALLMGGLFKLLAPCTLTPFCLAGNHDLSESVLTPDTALAVTQSTGLLHAVTTSECFAVASVGGMKVGLGGTPYGEPIPDDVSLYWPCPVDFGLWFTHADMAFPGSYPGALEFFEIAGCDMVVNGHMHLPQSPVTAGRTAWYNPGNILRTTITDKDRVPSVVSWLPGKGIETHALDHARDAFNLSGAAAAALMPLAGGWNGMDGGWDQDGDGSTPSGLHQHNSRFAGMMVDEMSGSQAPGTDDGAFLKEEIDALAAELGTKAPVMGVLDALILSCVTVT